MARTKQEVRDFLNSLVGQKVNAKAGVYNGQCVSLIKALLEFLGAPNPYAGRGNAIDVGDTLLRQGLAANNIGWLNVCVNRSMGRIFENGVWNNYGHIWIDINNEFNIEQNGARALYTTKNTRPVSQSQQIVNLDQYISDERSGDMITEKDINPVRVIMSEVEGWDITQIHSGSVDSQIMGSWYGKSWVEFIMHAWTVQKTKRGHLVAQINTLNQQIAELGKRPTTADIEALKNAAETAQREADEAEKIQLATKAQYDAIVAERAADEATGNAFIRFIGRLFGSGK